jgi:uncharacterized protein (DUF924 family)
MHADISTILEFWFANPADPAWETMRSQWWDKDPAFDQACRDTARDLHARGARGDFDHWAESPEGALALVVLFDQLPRNMFRGTPMMYVTDHRANQVARMIDARGWKRHYTPVQQLFPDMPFEHAERVADQEHHVAFVRDHYHGPQREDCLRSADRHLEIVARFGRFPHRNTILGRATTAEEAAFLLEPNSSY